MLFFRCRTQWRAGPGGTYGFDYTAFYPLMDRMHLSDEDWLLTLDELNAMESAALVAIHQDDSEDA